jgi:hypothetical protein
MNTTSYDVWGGLLVAPLLVALSLPAFRREAKRARDGKLFTLLCSALVLKLLGSVARYVLGFLIYDNKGDAYKYHLDALALIDRWSGGHVDLRGAIETPETFITFLTAIGQRIFRPSILIGFLLFSWLAFWGLFWCYRAFRIAVPEGRSRTYAKLIFFLPSLLFWPSSIGKEAWMLFVLGLLFLGAAQLLTGQRRLRALIPLSLGLLGAAAVRPHFAGIAAIALVCAFIVQKPAPSMRQLAPIVKLAAVAGVVVVAGFFLQRTEEFLTRSGLEVSGGLTSFEGVRTALGDASVQTEQGGSQFQAPGLGSPAGLALSVGTVLFRPFPFEAGDPQILVASLETLALAVLMLVRFRWVMAAIGSIRRQPYVAFLVAFLAGGVLVLASVANFGILARQRTLILPALVVLVSIPPPVRGSEGRRRVPRQGSRGEDLVVHTGTPPST